jgi:hypothetical protein
VRDYRPASYLFRSPDRATYRSFRTASHWLSFLDAPALLSSLRQQPPSLVYALLALATLLRSSELERGSAGRDRALVLRDAAQAALERAWDARAVVLSHAQAALALAFFEACAHPLHAPHRADAALALLDAVVAHLGLRALDAGVPRALDTAGGVPLVLRASGYAYPLTCTCDEEEAGEEDAHAVDGHEPARRLVWAALMLAATHSIACVASGRAPVPLELLNTSRVGLPCLPVGDYKKLTTHAL